MATGRQQLRANTTCGASIPNRCRVRSSIRLSSLRQRTAATDFLDRVEENARFHIDSLTTNTFATAKALFRQYERFSFVDACIVAYPLRRDSVTRHDTISGVSGRDTGVL